MCKDEPELSIKYYERLKISVTMEIITFSRDVCCFQNSSREVDAYKTAFGFETYEAAQKVQRCSRSISLMLA
jgi:hypothetical protein